MSGEPPLAIMKTDKENFMSGETEQAPKDPSTQLAEMQVELGRLKTENIRLRRDLIDPPADVQELVIQKLNLVSADALIPLQQENERLRVMLGGKLYGDTELLNMAHFCFVEGFEAGTIHGIDTVGGKMPRIGRITDANYEAAKWCMKIANYAKSTKRSTDKTAAASSVAATRVKSDDHAETQGEQKS